MAHVDDSWFGKPIRCLQEGIYFGKILKLCTIYNDGAHRLYPICLFVDGGHYEVMNDKVELYLPSPEEIEREQDQLRRKAHADKYL